MSEFQLLSSAEREAAVAFDGGFFQFLSVMTRWGKRECVRRKDGTFKATQVLPLWLPPEYARAIRQTGLLDRDVFVAQLLNAQLIDRLFVQLIGVERLLTQFSEFEFCRNAMLEIVGGVCNIGEEDVAGGLREFQEELKVPRDQILCWTALTGSMAYDGAAHNESTSLMAVVFTGEYVIEPNEGIVPELSTRCPLLECREYLERCVRNKIPVQGFAHAALTELLFLIAGGLPQVKRAIEEHSAGA
jgi:hypothetical protein